jgi:hypothetical protein
MKYPPTGESTPLTPEELVIAARRQYAQALVWAMPEEGVQEMYERLLEIAKNAGVT